jgi:hypothetical protein
MNNIYNILVNNGIKKGLINLNINEISNIANYSAEVLIFEELNKIKYDISNNVLGMLLEKLRPGSGVLILDILDMNNLCASYSNKILDTKNMSNILNNISSAYGIVEIKEYIKQFGASLSILKIEKNINNYTLRITIQRNAV